MLMALAFAACSVQRNTALPRNTSWTLINNRNSLVTGAANKPVFINFGMDRLSGFSGCNNYTANYAVGLNQAIQIGVVASTKMMCMDNRANLTEGDYLRKLTQVNRFEIQRGELRLYAGYRLLLRFRQ
jgi:heat shock protein HslJ